MLLLPNTTFQSTSWDKRFKILFLQILLHVSLLSLGNWGGGCSDLFLPELKRNFFLFTSFFKKNLIYFFSNLSGNEISLLATNKAFATLNFSPPCSQVLISDTKVTVRAFPSLQSFSVLTTAFLHSCSRSSLNTFPSGHCIFSTV